MFDKFGEFDSAEEINAVAKMKLIEGKKEDIFAIANENGIDEGDAEDYIAGYISELATVLSAAVGKVELESKELKVDGILSDWTGIVLQQCTIDEKFCVAVRKKGKALKYCMAALVKFAFESKVQVSDEIVKVTKVAHNGKEEPLRGPLYLGVPNAAEAKRIVREYYLGQEQS